MKEFGSDFELFLTQDSSSNQPFFEKDTSFFFSGRVALFSLIQLGVEVSKWERLYVPSYFCHEVYDFIEKLGIEIHTYSCLPTTVTLENPDFIVNKKSVFLVVNYFGINRLDYSSYTGMTIVEDLTHYLQGHKESTADYCFGSLRKIIPLAVGGFIYSPKNAPIPKLEPNFTANYVAHKKNAGMLLKKLYLTNQSVEKDVFRKLLIESEEEFSDHKTVASLPVMVKDELDRLPIEQFIEQKKENLVYAKSLLKKNPHFSIVTTEQNTDFALILKFYSQDRRDLMKQHLIRNRIYPMVLWPDQSGNDKKLELTLLFIHLDYRHEKGDIKFIIEEINKQIENV